jgi:hypothetical protein
MEHTDGQPHGAEVSIQARLLVEQVVTLLRAHHVRSAFLTASGEGAAY